MSHLVLVSEVPPADPRAVDHEGSDCEQDLDESRPLLEREEVMSSAQSGGTKVTSSFSLVPEASLSAQVRVVTFKKTLTNKPVARPDTTIKTKQHCVSVHLRRRHTSFS